MSNSDTVVDMLDQIEAILDYYLDIHHSHRAIKGNMLRNGSVILEGLVSEDPNTVSDCITAAKLYIIAFRASGNVN